MKINLNDIEKKSPFEVPDDYFDGLTSKIQSKITVNQRIGINWAYVLKWSLAPMILIVIFVGYYSQNANYDTNSSREFLVGVSNDEILSYLEESEITEIELLSLSVSPNNLIFTDSKSLDDINLGDNNINDLIEEYNLNDVSL
jgi:hypothetical protein